MEYDAIIVGGGPGGAGTAALLAQAGRRVLVVERERFPRYQIGESLVPYTYKLLERIGVLDAVAREGFVPKPGFHFVSPNGNLTRPIYFNDYIQDPAFGCWQVERGRFDQILLDHARAAGAEVREATSALDPIVEDGRVVGLIVRDEDGRSHALRSRFLVDASGRGTFLASRFGTKRRDPILDQMAVWRYMRGARRQPGIDAGNILVALLAPRGWFWWIPQRDDVTSIGVVSSRRWLEETGSSLPAIFDDNVRRNRLIAEWTEGGEWISELRTTADYSYKSTELYGPGWVLVGDAGAFIDPVFSSGMFLSLACAVMAAGAIEESFARADFGPQRFADYGVYVTRATTTFRMFLDAFYDEEFSARDMVREHPEQVDEWGRVMQGDVFEENRPFMRFLLDYRTALAGRRGRAPNLYVPPTFDEGVCRLPLRTPPPFDLTERKRRTAAAHAAGGLYGPPITALPFIA